MGNDFVDLYENLKEQRLALDELSTLYKAMSAPDFDPLMYTIDGFDPSALPENVTRILAYDLPDAQATCQLGIIGENIRLLKSTIDLIGAQSALMSLKADPKIQETMEQDKGAYPDVLKHTFFLNTANKEGSSQLQMEQTSLMERINDLSDEYVRAAEGHIPDELAGLDRKGLLQTIYDLRMDIAQASLGKTALSLQMTTHNLNGALIVKKAVDEGIFPASTYAENMSADLMRQVGKTLDSLPSAFKEAHLFVSRLFDMDPHNDGIRDFEATSYVPVSIRPITEFTP